MREVVPPQRVSADCQPQADVTSEPANAAAASQSQPADASERPDNAVGDEVAEQLRTQRQRDQRCDRSQEHGDVPFPQFEVEMHLVTTFRVGHEFLQVLSASPPHLYPQFMQGAIAAGNKVTAEAGASVLAEGGNAIDACIVAAFAAAVAEGPLTGPTGGGFLLAWVDGEATVLDCFFAAPSRPLGEIEDITVDFGDSTQSYHIGAGLGGGAGARGRPRGGTPPLRQRAVGAARRAGDRPRRAVASTRPKPSASCT